MKIYLIRHGESSSDIEDRYGGAYDDHLTPVGRSQAKELVVKLADKNIEVIFSSPLLRAKETADILKQMLGCDLKIAENLKERNRYGFLSGMKKSDARLKHTEEVETAKDYKNSIKGAETYEDFKKRVVIAFDELSNAKFDSIVIVAHAGPISCIFRSFGWGEISQLGNCAFFEVIKEKDQFSLSHIENAELE